jgi:hypothetical protein
MSDFSSSSDEDIESQQKSNYLKAAIKLTAGEFTKYRRKPHARTAPTVVTFSYIKQQEKEQAPDVKLHRVGACSMFMVPQLSEEDPEECADDDTAA